MDDFFYPFTRARSIGSSSYSMSFRPSITEGMLPFFPVIGHDHHSWKLLHREEVRANMFKTLFEQVVSYHAEKQVPLGVIYFDYKDELTFDFFVPNHKGKFVSRSVVDRVQSHSGYYGMGLYGQEQDINKSAVKASQLPLAKREQAMPILSPMQRQYWPTYFDNAPTLNLRDEANSLNNQAKIRKSTVYQGKTDLIWRWQVNSEQVFANLYKGTTVGYEQIFGIKDFMQHLSRPPYVGPINTVVIEPTLEDPLNSALTPSFLGLANYCVDNWDEEAKWKKQDINISLDLTNSVVSFISPFFADNAQATGLSYDRYAQNFMLPDRHIALEEMLTGDYQYDDYARQLSVAGSHYSNTGVFLPFAQADADNYPRFGEFIWKQVTQLLTLGVFNFAPLTDNEHYLYPQRLPGIKQLATGTAHERNYMGILPRMANNLDALFEQAVSFELQRSIATKKSSAEQLHALLELFAKSATWSMGEVEYNQLLLTLMSPFTAGEKFSTLLHRKLGQLQEKDLTSAKISDPLTQVLKEIPDSLDKLRKQFLTYQTNIKTYASQYLNYMWADPLATVLANFNLEAIVEPDWTALEEFAKHYWQVEEGQKADWLEDKIGYYKQVWSIEQAFALYRLWKSDGFKTESLKADVNLLEALKPVALPFLIEVANKLIQDGHFAADSKTKDEIAAELWESYKIGYLNHLDNIAQNIGKTIEKVFIEIREDLYNLKDREEMDVYLSNDLDYDVDALYAKFNEYLQTGSLVTDFFFNCNDDADIVHMRLREFMMTVASRWALNISSAIDNYNYMAKRINIINAAQTLMADYVLSGEEMPTAVLSERLLAAVHNNPTAREAILERGFTEDQLSMEAIREATSDTFELLLNTYAEFLNSQNPTDEKLAPWLHPFGNQITPYHLFVLRDTLTEQAAVHGEPNHGAYAQFLGLLNPDHNGLTISTSDQFRRPSSGSHYKDRPTTNLILAHLSLDRQLLELAGLDTEAAFENLAYSMIRLAGYYNQTMPHYQRYFENQLLRTPNLNSLKKLPTFANKGVLADAKITTIAEGSQLENGFYYLGEAIDSREVDSMYANIAEKVAQDIKEAREEEAEANAGKKKSGRKKSNKAAPTIVDFIKDKKARLDSEDKLVSKYGFTLLEEVESYNTWGFASLLHIPSKSAQDYLEGSLVAQRFYAVNLGSVLNNLQLNWSSKPTADVYKTVAGYLTQAQELVANKTATANKKGRKKVQTATDSHNWLSDKEYFLNQEIWNLQQEIYQTFNTQWRYSPFSSNGDLAVVETYLNDFMTPKAQVDLFSSKFGELLQQKHNNKLHYHGNFANLTRLNYHLDLVQIDPDTSKLNNIDLITNYGLNPDESYGKTTLNFQGRAWLERWANPKTLKVDETLAFVQGLGEGKISRQVFYGLPYQTISTAKINNLQFLAQAKSYLFDLYQPDYLDQVQADQFILDPSLASYKYLEALSPLHKQTRAVANNVANLLPRPDSLQQNFFRVWVRELDYQPGMAPNYAAVNFASFGDEQRILTASNLKDFENHWLALTKRFLPQVTVSLHLPTNFSNFQALNQYFEDAVFSTTEPSKAQLKAAEEKGAVEFVTQAAKESQEYFFYTQLSKLKAGIYPKHYFTTDLSMDAGIDFRLRAKLAQLQKQNQRTNYGLTVARITHQLQPYTQYLAAMRQSMLNNEGYIMQGGSQTAVRLQLTADLEFLRLLDKTFTKENFVADNLLYTTEQSTNKEFWKQAYDISMGYTLNCFGSGMRHSGWIDKFPYHMANLMYNQATEGSDYQRYDFDTQVMITNQLTPAQELLPKPKHTNLSKEITFWLGDNAVRNLEFLSKPFTGLSFEFSRGGSLNLSKLPILSVIDLQDMANPYREELNPNDRPSVPDALSEAYDIRSLNIQRGILSGSFDFTTGGMLQLHNYCHNLYLGTSRSVITHPEKVEFRALEREFASSDEARNILADFVNANLLKEQEEFFKNQSPENADFIAQTISSIADRLGISHELEKQGKHLACNFAVDGSVGLPADNSYRNSDFSWGIPLWNTTVPFRNRNREQWIHNFDHFSNWQHAQHSPSLPMDNLGQGPQAQSKLSADTYAHFDLYRQDLEGLIAHTEVNKDIADEVYQVWQESQSGSISSQLCWGTNQQQRKLLVDAIEVAPRMQFDLSQDYEIRQEAEKELKFVVSLLGEHANKETKDKLEKYFRIIEAGYYNFEGSYFNRIPFEVTCKAIEQLLTSLKEVEQALFSYQLTARTCDLLHAITSMTEKQLTELVNLRFAQLLTKIQQLETDLIPCLILTVAPKATSKEFNIVSRLRDLIYSSPLLRILREQLMMGSDFSKFVAQREQEDRRAVLAASPVTAFLSKSKKAKKNKGNNAPTPGIRQAQIKDRYLKAAIEEVPSPGMSSFTLAAMGVIQERIMLGVDKASPVWKIWELPINDTLRKQSYALCDIAVARSLTNYFTHIYSQRVVSLPDLDYYKLADSYCKTINHDMVDLAMSFNQAKYEVRSNHKVSYATGVESDLLANLTADLVITQVNSVNYQYSVSEALHASLAASFAIAQGLAREVGELPQLNPSNFKSKVAKAVTEKEVKARTEQLFKQIREELDADVEDKRISQRFEINEKIGLLALRQLSLEKLVQFPLFAPYIDEEKKAKYHAYLQEVYRIGHLILDSEGDKKAKLIEVQIWLLSKAQDIFIDLTQSYFEEPWTINFGMDYESEGTSPQLVHNIYKQQVEEIANLYRTARHVWDGHRLRLNTSLGLRLQELSQDQFEIDDTVKKEVRKEIKGEYPSLYETYFNPKREVKVKPLHLDFIDPSKLDDHLELSQLQSPELMAKIKGFEDYLGFNASDIASSKAKPKTTAKAKTSRKATTKSTPKTTGKTTTKVEKNEVNSIIPRLIAYMPYLNQEPALAELMDVVVENIQAVIFGETANLEQLKLVLEACQEHYGEVEQVDPSIFQSILANLGNSNKEVQAPRAKLATKQAKAKATKAKAEKEAKAAKAKADKEAKAAQLKAEKAAKAAQAKAEKEAKALALKAAKAAKAAQLKAEKEAKAAKAKAEKEAKAAQAKAEKEAKALALKEAKAAKAAQLKADKEAKAAKAKAEKEAKAAQLKAEKAAKSKSSKAKADKVSKAKEKTTKTKTSAKAKDSDKTKK